MPTVRQYFGVIRNWQNRVCQLLGVNLEFGTQEVRVVAAADVVMVSILIKTLVDKGLITDQDIIDAWNTAQTDPGWQQEPTLPAARPPE